MNRISFLFSMLLTLLLLSCSSSSKDEPDDQYSWQIIYEEMFQGTINNSEEYKMWFEEQHCSGIATLDFVIYDPQTNKYIRHSPRDYEAWEYRNSPNTLAGYILWYQNIPKAKESTIKKNVMQFESFSIPENNNNQYDRFKAAYHRLDENP